MRLPLILLFLVISSHTFAQSAFKINPFRSLFGEVHAFYEQPIKGSSYSIELKGGIVYPHSFINVLSDYDNRFGWASYIDGLNNGIVLGVGLRRYIKGDPGGLVGNEIGYYQISIGYKSLEMNNVDVIHSHQSQQDYRTLINGEHKIFNPKFSIGMVSPGKFVIEPYLGLGATIRMSKITKVGACDFRTEEECLSAVKGLHSSLHGTIVGPSIHVGCLFGFRTKKMIQFKDK